MKHAILCLLAILALTASCTRENAAFCCIDAADCAAQGVQEGGRHCTDGLSCVDNKCVASTCAASGCASTAPVCEIATDVCVGCTDSTECVRFPATDVCDMTSGSCVECVANIDCDPSKPICDLTSCRGCERDLECSSGACADNGSCVAEDEIVYVEPTGTDTLACSRAQPCLTLKFALAQVNQARNHIVFRLGTYTDPGLTGIYQGQTTAEQIWIHGGGATVNAVGPNTSDGFLYLGIPSVLRDIELVNQQGSVLSLATTATIERVRIRGGAGGISSNGTVTLRDVDIRVAYSGIALGGGSMRADRVTILGGLDGVNALQPTNIDFTNVLVGGSTRIGMDLSGSSGTAAFITVGHTGDSGTGPTGIKCTQSVLQLSASIIYAPTFPNRPTVEGSCTVGTSIVGPTPFPNTMNVLPGFLNPAMGDYRISGGSMARDLVNTGPPHDFEGDPRPRGVRFDIGADEAP